MKTRGKTLVPRNPFALAASQRHAGAHDKRHKVKRRDDKQALKRELSQMKKGGSFVPPFLFALNPRVAAGSARQGR
ncbi:hypothetical protein [Silvimonas iriomotensis]|uniref:Uncharacterized protein n=1 Tax=Silvimonas iriomotensis TaxID=449662 RepID=A0ABQ2P4F7_9NEIS|nr:hypothetical protein [Silvimonas iriomotensis]GGP17841.1 hypothetical protein GCM10010970_01820 [Silvimonas iriomotensis]